MVRGYVPAWCERQGDSRLDGRYVVACYFTRDGHPVSKARAERVELAEYAPDGTLLRIEEGVIDSRVNDSLATVESGIGFPI